jgi:hypothetical protein
MKTTTPMIVGIVLVASLIAAGAWVRSMEAEAKAGSPPKSGLVTVRHENHDFIMAGSYYFIHHPDCRCQRKDDPPLPGPPKP